MGLMKNLATMGERPDTRSFDHRYPGWRTVRDAWRRARPDAAAVLDGLRAGVGTDEQRAKWDAWYRGHCCG